MVGRFIIGAVVVVMVAFWVAVLDVCQEIFALGLPESRGHWGPFFLLLPLKK